MRSFFCFFLFLAASTLSNAQTKTSIYGKLLSKEGKPIGLASILLKETRQYTTSDSSGNYSFQEVVPGKYTLIVSYVGYLVETRTVTAGNDPVELNILAVENYGDLQEVQIVAQKGLNQKTPATGKAHILNRDLPQLTQTIERSVIEHQQANRMSDVLQNTSGVYIMGNTGGYQEEIASRGYAFNSNNTFKNGARFNNGISPELSGAEKIEFLKGGAAILYGNVSAGGIMNIITKKPKMQQGGEIAFRTGSYDFYKPSLDIYGPLGNSNKLAYRINSSYEKSRSYRDKVSGERIYFNPSFLYQAGKNTEILIEMDHLRDRRTLDYGIGAINYEIPDVPRSNFIGVDWGYNSAIQSSVTASVSHRINHVWQVKGMYSFQQYDQELFGAARPNANSQMVSANGTWIRGLQKSGTKEKYQMAEIDLTGTFKTAGIGHQLLIGADVDNYETIASTYNTNLYNNGSSNASLKNKNIYDTINIYSPTQKRNDIPDLTLARTTTSPIDRFGVYIQDLISLTNNVKLLAGVRYSNQRNRNATVDTVGKTQGSIKGYNSDAFSPKIGLVYQPIKTISLFASYTNNFSPNTGTDSNNIPLKPSIIHQYEMGMKNDLFNSLLSVNFTVYRIINSDFAQTVTPPPASNPSARELAGEVTSNGFEVDIQTKNIKGFTVIAGYSYNDSRYTESNSFKENDRLRYNPLNTANFSIYYQFSEGSVLRRFNMGAGVYYVDDRVAGRNTTVANPGYALMTVPDYALADIHFGYRIKKTELRLKLTNITNVLSYNIHDDNSVNPIAPRQFSFTLSQKL